MKQVSSSRSFFTFKKTHENVVLYPRRRFKIASHVLNYASFQRLIHIILCDQSAFPISGYPHSPAFEKPRKKRCNERALTAKNGLKKRILYIPFMVNHRKGIEYTFFRR